MKKNIPSLQKCRLFAGMSPADLEILLGCLQPRQKSFYKNNYILTTEESPNMAGIVLSGAVHIVSDDEHDGRRRIIERIENGGMFAADFCHAHHEELTVSAIAAEKTEVLFVDYRRILDACSSACTFHTKLLKNFVILQAKQKVALLKKLEHITQSTTRKKLLSYLKEEARLFEKSRFRIPFNHEELAHYLSVERSGLSAELSKMRRDGLIRYEKKHFELLVEL